MILQMPIKWANVNLSRIWFYQGGIVVRILQHFIKYIQVLFLATPLPITFGHFLVNLPSPIMTPFMEGPLVSLLWVNERYPITPFKCQLSLLRSIWRFPTAPFKSQSSHLWIIERSPIASFKCRSSRSGTIHKIPIAPFIPIESFSNSSKFGHWVVYSIAPIIR